MMARNQGDSRRGTRRTRAAGRGARGSAQRENAVQRQIRATLLRGLAQWLAAGGMTQTEAAKVLNVTQARVSDIKRGKVGQFSLDLLVRLAGRAGLRPQMRLTRKRAAARAQARDEAD